LPLFRHFSPGGKGNIALFSLENQLYSCEDSLVMREICSDGIFGCLQIETQTLGNLIKEISDGLYMGWVWTGVLPEQKEKEKS
jgi:hypothetical protein